MFSNATRLEILLEAVRDALVGMDQKGVIRFVNRQTELLFGYDRDDLIGEHIEKLVPEALWQVYASHRESYFADSRTRSSGLDLELSGRRQNGREFPINVSLSHIDTGDVLLVITGADEVAKQKEAVRNAERITAIVEYSEDAIIATTSKGVITDWNPAAERMYGYPSREIIGKSIELLSPKDRSGEIEAILAKVKAGQVVARSETERVRKDGTVFPVSLTVSPIRDSDGVVVGTSTIARDVTELSQAVARAQELFEVAPDALVEVDQDGVIRSVNRQTELVFGYDRDALVGQLVETLVPESFRAVHPGHRASYGADPVVRPMGAELELAGRRRDGTEFPVEISLSSVRTKDGLLVTAAVRDVTEQRRAFEAAQRKAAIIEHSYDAIIGETLDGIITSWNPAAERMYGYPSREIIGKSIELLSPKDRSGEIEAILAKVKAGQVVERSETERVRKDGTVFPVSLTVSPIRDSDGVVVGASTIARDVTELRQAFEAAQYMKAIVESSDDAIISRTIEGIITSWNPAAERMYGYTSAEIIGQSIDRLIPEDGIAESGDVLAKIKQGQPVERLETMRVRKDGTLVPVSSTLSPIRGQDGDIVGISAIHRDVSQQRQAFEVAQQMAAIIESSDESVIGQSLEGIITSWNPAAERTYGYSREEMIGQPISALMPQDRHNEMHDNLARIKAGQHVERVQTIRIRKDGTRIPISLALSPIHSPDGEICGVSGIGRDLSEQELAAQYARSLIEVDLDPLITISAEGKITDVNEATVKITGVRRDKLIGSDYWEYVTEPDKAIDFIQEVLTRGVLTDLPLTVRHQDGTLTHVVCNASVYRDFNGDVLGVLATGRQVTKTP